MTTRLLYRIFGAVVALSIYSTHGGEPDFYERFTSLIQTNCFGPNLTNATLSLGKIRQSAEIAGVKIGSGMSEAVEKWGKPRNVYASCGGGPLLMFGHGSTSFRGNRVARITIYPNQAPGLRFDAELMATNTPAQFAQVLGVPDPGPAPWALYVDCPYGVLELRWGHFAVGGWQLSSLSVGPKEKTEDKAP